MTRDELDTFVLERLGVDSSRTAFVTQIRSWVNTEYVSVVGELELNQKRADVGVTADDPTVVLPVDFLKALSIRRGGSPMIDVTPERLAELQASAALGASAADGPLYYCYFPLDRLEVVPTPTTTDATLLQLRYIGRPTLLTAGANIPSLLPVEFHPYLGEMAVYRMAPNQEEPGIGQDAFAAAQLLKERFREQLSEAAGSTTNRVRRVVYG